MQSDLIGLGHYQIRRLLGEGGFGQVYEAWDAKLQRSIAIKRLKPQIHGARPDNLVDEARMAASLRHPAFVKIFSIDGDAEQQSIIMEYVDGLTLRSSLHQQPLPEAQALDIVRQVAEAMSEAHAASLIHGDLKPSNLMLEPSGVVRIMDFGLARRIDPQATESVKLDETQGTIAYLAPELLLGVRPNPLSDVYSLGVVLYELLNGERPFNHLSGLALAAAQIQSSSALWPFKPEVSAAAAALVRRMTARDPAARLVSMEAVRSAIATLHSPVPAMPSMPSMPALLPLLRRQRRWLAASAVLVLALGAAYALHGSGLLQRSAPFSEAAAMQEGLAAVRTFDRDGSIDTAIARFSAILARTPDHAAAAAGLALAYALRYGNNSRDATWLQRADASAQLAVKLDDQLALAYAAQASVRAWQGKPEEALALAERALRLDPRSVFALTTQSGMLIRLRRLDEADKVLAGAIQAMPREHIFFDTLGSLRYNQGQLAAAEQALRQSIALQPDSIFSYASLASVLQRAGRDEESMQVLQQGLQVRPNSRLYTNLGNALFSRGDYVDSAKAFEQAVSVARGGPNDYLYWANLADALRWIPGREKDSVDAYRRAATLLKTLQADAPTDMTLASRMGLYSARIGERAEAARLSRLAVDAMGESADVRFRAAMAFELTGQRELALAELQAARARGYPLKLIESEPDLLALRRDPRFLQPATESEK